MRTELFKTTIAIVVTPVLFSPHCSPLHILLSVHPFENRSWERKTITGNDLLVPPSLVSLREHVGESVHANTSRTHIENLFSFFSFDLRSLFAVVLSNDSRQPGFLYGAQRSDVRLSYYLAVVPGFFFNRPMHVLTALKRKSRDCHVGHKRSVETRKVQFRWGLE